MVGQDDECDGDGGGVYSGCGRQAGGDPGGTGERWGEADDAVDRHGEGWGGCEGWASGQARQARRYR